MLELQITDNDVSSGSAQISWCVDAEVLKELADQKVKDPQLVIVVAPEGDNYDIRKEVRKVVPLKDLMTYMEFRAAGKNRVWGLVSHKTKKEARDHYLDKKEGLFHTHVLDSRGEGYSSWLTDTETADAQHSGQYRTLSHPLSVDVPKEIFAAEPAAWEKTWVNHFFRNKVVDQCEFRRRRLFAYLVQPLLIGGKMLGIFIVLLAGLLTGARSWSIKYLLHPLTYSPFDAGEVWNKGTLFIRHLKEDEDGTVFRSGKPPTPWYFFRSFWPLFFMPAIVIPAILLVCFGKLQQLALLGTTLGAIFLTFLGVLAIICYGERMFSWAPRIPKFFRWLIDKIIGPPNNDLWYLKPEELDLIVCSEKRSHLTYKQIPARRKTVRLRFQNLKSKVCRPFSL